MDTDKMLELLDRDTTIKLASEETVVKKRMTRRLKVRRR